MPNFREEPFDSHLDLARVTVLFEGPLKTRGREAMRKRDEGRWAGSMGAWRSGESGNNLAFMGIICFRHFSALPWRDRLH